MDPILTLTVHGTHFFLIDCRGGRLLVDAGWELERFKAQLKAHRVGWSEIHWVMFTHHHPDHAGLVQEVKRLCGARMIIHERQVPFLPALRDFAERKGGATPVLVEPGDLVSPGRAELAAIGVPGVIVETPGHSPDSVSLVLDGGAAFIGDLPAPELVDPESQPEALESYRRLLALGARRFYHSHAPPFSAGRVRALME